MAHVSLHHLQVSQSSTNAARHCRRKMSACLLFNGDIGSLVMQCHLDHTQASSVISPRVRPQGWFSKQHHTSTISALAHYSKSSSRLLWLLSASPFAVAQQDGRKGCLLSASRPCGHPPRSVPSFFADQSAYKACTVCIENGRYQAPSASYPRTPRAGSRVMPACVFTPPSCDSSWSS